MNNTLKKTTQLGAFTALAVTMGYLFSVVPNVEMVTATIFIAGFIMGPWEGLAVGIVAEGLYSLFNPYGPAAPPLFIAQVVSMAITGFVGGHFGKHRSGLTPWAPVYLALAGLGLSLLFAVLTTLSFMPLAGLSFHQLTGSFIYGIGFYLTHILSNTLIFLTVVPILIRVLSKVIPTLGVASCVEETT